MRFYTVSSIDSWITVKGLGKQASAPKLGKNGGPLCVSDGIISSFERCEAFVKRKLKAGACSVSPIRKWRK